MGRIWRRYWPYLTVSAGAALLFAPFLLGRQVLYWGTPLLQFYPWRQFALEAMRAGHLPLWNPYLGLGAPLIANYQSAIFYPPNWIALVVPLDYAMGLLAAAHLAWAGAGMVRLAGSLGLRPFAQAVAGLAFGLSQYLVARAGFLTINAAAAWLPWVIWAAERVITAQPQVQSLELVPLWHAALRPRSARPSTTASPPLRTGAPRSVSRAKPKGSGWRPSTNLASALSQPVLLLALCLSLQLLAGHAQTTWYTWLILAAWILWRLVSSKNFGALVRGLLTLSASAILALALAAIQLLPTAELLRESPRAASAQYEFAATYSYSPWRLLTLIAPDLLGNPGRGLFYGYGNYWEDAAYAGMLPLLLALGAALAAWRRSPLARFLTGLALVSLALALGRNTPVFPFLYQFVPTFNLFQAPARMLIGLTFALALLAGMGAEAWDTPAGRALYWTRLGAAGAFAATAVSAAVYYYLPALTALGHQLHTVAGALGLAGLSLFISAVLALTRRPASVHWQAAVFLFVLADLLYAGAGLNPGAPPDLYRASTEAGRRLAARLDGHRLFQFPADEYALKYETLFAFSTFGPPAQARLAREAQLPNTALLDGLASANNFDPLVPARYAALLAALERTRSAALLRLMDVGWIASSTPLAGETLPGGEAAGFYRAAGEARRVWVVYDSQTAADAPAALEFVASPDFDPAASVILEAGDPGTAAAAPLPAGLGASPGFVSVTASLERSGWVVLSDIFYPGWHAYVDGRPASLYHGDYAFRAVPVPAGVHTVSFWYRPWSFRAGLVITLSAVLIWLGPSYIHLRRARRHAG